MQWCKQSKKLRDTSKEGQTWLYREMGKDMSSCRKRTAVSHPGSAVVLYIVNFYYSYQSMAVILVTPHYDPMHVDVKGIFPSKIVQLDTQWLVDQPWTTVPFVHLAWKSLPSLLYFLSSPLFLLNKGLERPKVINTNQYFTIKSRYQRKVLYLFSFAVCMSVSLSFPQIKDFISSP